MKISQYLRAAIRSADKSQPDNSELRRKYEGEAIAALFKRKPSTRAAWESAQKLRVKAKKLSEDAWNLEQTLGIETGYGGDKKTLRVRNEEAFTKIGGKLPTIGRKWKFDSVMAELAAADPKQEKSILMKYGIKWE